MVIVGPKPFIYEEPKVVEEKWKHGFFNLRKIKASTQNFSSTVMKASDQGETAAAAAEERKSRIFNFDQIKIATLDFNPVNQIGKGGAGTVYKGVLPDGNVIAVKQFSSSSNQGIQSFQNEVKTLTNLRHRNIVRLLGSCTQKKQHLLIYEFMENNSLQTSLFGSADLKSRLNWSARIKICLGIAKGLAYLHEDAMPRLVHRDIKLSNILLDKELNPKICDFGIARPFFEDNDTIEITTTAGTVGYIAPECFHVMAITEKIDVYSFGIVLLELMTGKSLHKMNESVKLLECAHNILTHEGDLLKLIDTRILIDMDSTVQQATTVFKLAMLCTNPSPVVRPSMSEVVSILEGKSTIMKVIPAHVPYTYSMASNFDWSQDFSMTNISTNFSSPKGVDKLDDECDIDYGPINLNVSRVEREDAKIDSGSTSEAIGDSIIDGEGKDAKSLIKGNVSTSETPKSIDRSLTASFEESAKMGDQGNFEGHSIVKLNKSTNEGKKDSNILAMPSNVVSISQLPRFNENLTTSLSFVDATKMDNEAQLEYFEPLFEEGKLHIECSDKELEEECNKWKHSLVGFFVGEKPPFNVDATVVRKLWKLKGNVSVFTIGNGYFLFQFNCVEDKVRVLESSGLWHVEQTPLVLRKWDWKLNFDKADDNMVTLPIWVKIYNLPLYLWSPSFLGKVGSGLGIPLYCDEKTMNKKRLDFARVCIEFTATKPLPESFSILVKGVEYKLNLEYDWKPSRCATCCTFERCTSGCPQKVESEKNEQCKLEKGSLPEANETLHWDVFEQFYICACELLSPSDSLQLTVGDVVFHTQRDTEIFIILDDIFYICKPEDLCINNILLYIRLLEDKIMKEGKQHEFGFLNPNVICGGKKNSDQLVSIITQRIQNATTEFLFIPYNQDWHWVLMVIKIDLTKMDIVNIFWLDPLGLEIRYNFKDIMNGVMQCLCIDGNTRNEPTWTIPKVVPKQASNWECGFYVLRYMKEIIGGQPNPVTTTKSFRKHRYKLEDLDEVRLEWIRYIEPYLRIQKCIS